MPPTHDPLAGIRSKIEWTKKHIRDLEEVVQSFLATDPYPVIADYNPDNRELQCKVTHIRDVPTDVAQIAGDALCGMVSILDHLAYRLWRKGGGAGDGRHVYFPITSKTTLAEHKTARQRKVQGIPAPIIAAMDAIEPYKGGKGHQLFVLNELNNLSKHRDLIAVGAQFAKAALVPGPVPSAFMSGSGGMIFKAAPARCPLQVGDVVFSSTGIAKIEGNPQINFGFEIALNEPQIIQSKPIIETIHQLLGLVDAIVGQFAAYL